MRSIYLKKPRGFIFKDKPWYRKECPSCGGPKPVQVVGYTVGGKPLYHCQDKWHEV